MSDVRHLLVNYLGLYHRLIYNILLFRYKKKVLDLAKQHDKASEVEKVQRYQMPSEKGELQQYLEEDLKEKVASIHARDTETLDSLKEAL